MSDAVLIECTNTVTNDPRAVTTSYKVVGFKTNPKLCYKDLVIYEVKIGNLSVSLVWDAANNVIYKEPVVTSDAAYQAWYAQQKPKTSYDMFPGQVSSGADYTDYDHRVWQLEPTRWYRSEQETRCPQLVTSGYDWDRLEWALSPQPIIYGQSHMTAANTHKFRTGSGTAWSNAECTKYCSCPIPSMSPDIVTGFYVKTDTDDIINYNTLRGIYDWTRTWVFPYGDPIVLSGYYEYDVNVPYLIYLYTMPFSVQASIYGKYSNRIIANAFIMQCQTERYYNDWHLSLDANYFNVYAQAIYNETSVTNIDWIAQGRNTALEEKLAEAAALAYSLKTGSPPYLGWCTVDITIL